MKKNTEKIIIAGLNDTKKETKKNQADYFPKPSTEITYYTRGDYGVPISIKDIRGLAIEIDGSKIDQKDFKKIFPTHYQQFNVSISENLKTTKAGKLERTKDFYMYFPKEMLEERAIKVFYRKRKEPQVQQIIDLTVDKAEMNAEEKQAV